MMCEIYEYCIDDNCHCEHKAGVLIVASCTREEAEAWVPSPGYQIEIKEKI